MSHLTAFLGRTVMQIPHVFYLDEANQSTSHRGTSLSFYCVLIHILHYWLFSHLIFYLLSKNGLSNYTKINLLFSYLY